jgi:hypothetical protein
MQRSIFCFLMMLFLHPRFAQSQAITTQHTSVDSILVKGKSPDSTLQFNIPIFSTSGGDLDADLEQQDISSLLLSSRDVFNQFGAFQFGAARYRIRGYSAKNQMVMVNGINVNNPESGFSSWSSWGGLNDVTRFIENRFGNTANRYGFSGIGGYTNIDSKASSFKKGSRISYAHANRVFSNRLMLTHSTGILDNGWAFTLSASTRAGNQVYVPGTYFLANAFYLSADKKMNDRHLLSFTGFGAPIEQGRSTAAQKEVYQLTNNNYYNSLWGYQNDQIRNAAISNTNRPMLMLSHVFDINQSSKLTSSVFYTFGKTSLSGLNWNNAPNPRPDYYRYLPSYYYQIGDSSTGDLLQKKWHEDVNTRQINWDRLIAINRGNLYTLPSQLGHNINTTETRSRYILENRIEDLKHKGYNIVYNVRIRNFFISSGATGSIYSNRKYKQMEDLLGGTFWIDHDQFAENLGVDREFAQNDLEHPDKKIYQGDKFGYDYAININKNEMWSQLEHSSKNLDLYIGMSLSNTLTWREGFLANGKFPNNSKGQSEKLRFLNYGAKGGLTYKISGRQFVSFNISTLSRSPELNNIFISPRVRNDIITPMNNEIVSSGDLNYLIKSPGFQLRATLYHTAINNQTWLRSYWHDLYNNNVNYILTGVNQKHQGLELGLSKTIFTSHLIQAAFGFGHFYYSNQPIAQAWQDNNNRQLFAERKVYWNNYKLGGSPQMVSGLGYKFSSVRHWFAGLYINHFDRIYLDMNPDRRTAEAIDKFVDTESEEYRAIIEQERLPAYFTINVHVGKSFRLLKKHYLNFNLSVNNALNNKNNLTGGFEQLRWDQNHVATRFPPKYYYMLGTTYMLAINFSF